MTKTNFPKWVPPDVVEHFLVTREGANTPPDTIEDEMWNPGEYWHLYGGLGKYPPIQDDVAVEHEAFFLERINCWVEFSGLRLITEWEARTIWQEMIPGLIEPDQFYSLCFESYIGHRGDKLSHLRAKEREKFLAELAALLGNLAEKISGTHYDLWQTWSHWEHAQDIIRNTSKDIPPDIQSSIFGALVSATNPLSVELCSLSKRINQEIECKGYLRSNYPEEADDDFSPTPPFEPTHMTPKGHRSQFYRHLAFYLNHVTGNPRPTLVAYTTNIVFPSENKIEPNDVSKHWKTKTFPKTMET